MSRKHYVEAARIVREAAYLSEDVRTRLIADLVTFFADDNPRFSLRTLPRGVRACRCSRCSRSRAGGVGAHDGPARARQPT